MADDSTPSPIAPPALGKILQCFSGSFVAGTMAMLAYRIMLSIAANFAARPVLSDNPAVANISAAVRTLVVGMAALGAWAGRSRDILAGRSIAISASDGATLYPARINLPE